MPLTWPWSDHARTRANISAYIDRRLDSLQLAQVEAHIATCPSCQRELDTMRATVGHLGRLSTVQLPRSFVLTSVPQRHTVLFYNLRSATAAMGALAALLIAVNTVLLGPRSMIVGLDGTFGSVPSTRAPSAQTEARPADRLAAPSQPASPGSQPPAALAPQTRAAPAPPAPASTIAPAAGAPP